MSNLLQYVDLLEDFPSRVLILNICLIDTLDCYILARQFMNPQSDFTESSLT